MAFQSQMKCPNCGGQLKLSYDQTMMVQCDSCESTFTIDDISRHINSIKYGTRINNDDIYAKEKFNEALTTKNICNLKDEALIRRMFVALETENYNELRQYVDELKRREPDNYLVYEYSILMKYKVFKLEELIDIKQPFWEDRNYIILYRIADQFKRHQLDEITSKAKEKYKKVAKKTSRAFAWNKFASIFATILTSILPFLPFIVTIVSAIILFANYKQAALLGSAAGLTVGWVFFLIASLAVGIPSIVLSFKDRSSKRVPIIIGCCLSGFGTLMTIIGAVQIEPNFNPGNQIYITLTGISDDIRYSNYETTFFMEIKNESRYSFDEFGLEIDIYKGNKSLGSYDAWFSNNFMANDTVDTSLTFTSQYSTIYNATLSEMTFRYKVKYITKGIINHYFTCVERIANKRY